MTGSGITARQVLAGFLEALRALPGVQAECCGAGQQTGPGQGHDARVDLQVGGEASTLLVQVRRTVYPRDARQVLWQTREAARGCHSPEAVFFLAADSISPGAKDLLRDEGVGYYDSGGSLFLPAANIYIYVDRPPPKALARSIRSVFSGRSAQVLHAVLMRDREWFGVQQIAEQAIVSPATASQVLMELEKFDWVASRGRGPQKQRHLRDPAALLDAWTDRHAVMPPLSMRRYFVPSVRAQELPGKLARACAGTGAEYALTHKAAGQLYAPFLSSISRVHCRLLGGPAANAALGALDARPVDEGANLAVIEAGSPGGLLFRQEVDGVRLASVVQVYLDLMRSTDRSRELAAHLRRERLGF